MKEIIDSLQIVRRRLVIKMSKDIRVIDVARRNVITCHPDEALRNVAKMMVDHWISSVLVIERDKPIGIITDGIIFRLKLINSNSSSIYSIPLMYLLLM